MEFRSLINTLIDQGEMVKINRKIDPRNEMAAILLEMENRGNKAVLFENIAGKTGMAVGNVYTTAERILLSLEIPREIEGENPRKQLKKILQNLEHNYVDHDPYVLVPREPDQFLQLEDVNNLGDLLSAPLYIEDKDEPYINAAVLMVSDGSKFTTQVVQVQSKKNGVLAISAVSPPMTELFEEFAQRRQKLEATLSIGVASELMLAAIMPPALAGVDKLKAAALLGKRPLPMFSGRVLSMPVPVEAEYVIEGFIKPWVTTEIGPYISYYKTPYVSKRACMFETAAVTYRKNPIYQSILSDGEETITLVALLTEISLEKELKELVKDDVEVYLRPGGCLHNAVVAVGREGARKAREIIDFLLKKPFLLKNVIIIDNALDPQNSCDVEWALAARTQSDNDVIIILDQFGSPMDPSAGEGGRTAKFGINATLPPGQNLARSFIPREVIAKVKQEWTTLLRISAPPGIINVP
jgi:UbiD family decarboxylase